MLSKMVIFVQNNILTKHHALYTPSVVDFIHLLLKKKKIHEFEAPTEYM